MLGDPGTGATIRLRSGARGSPIKDHSRAALIGGPYPSVAEAEAVAGRAKRALLIWAVRSRIGIDLGGRPPRGVITTTGLQWLTEQSGGPVRTDVHGIDIFEHVDGLVFATFNAEVALGKAAPAFVEQVAASITTPLSLSAKQALAGEILSASYFDASDGSRFITLITAAEALLDPKPRATAAQELVSKLIQIVHESGLDKATRALISGSLQRLKSESIGQAGRALADRLLPGRVYHGQPPARFFTFCYNLRSSILHNGAVPAGTKDFPSVCAAAQELACDLLIASFAEVNGRGDK